MSDFGENPNWGTPSRGVAGRGPGDYSAKIANNSFQPPQTAYKVQQGETSQYDPHNLQMRWSTPKYKSYVRGPESMSRPGYVPRAED